MPEERYVQLRPAVALVPTIQVPHTDLNVPTDVYYQVIQDPVEERILYHYPIFDPVPPVAFNDVSIQITARINVAGSGGFLRGTVHGHSASIALGTETVPSLPGEVFIWLGQIGGNAPDCPAEPAILTLTIPANEWNEKIAGHSASLSFECRFPDFAEECVNRFIDFQFSYKTPGEEEGIEYTAETYIGLQSFGKTHVGCNGTPARVQAQWAIDLHTCTFRPMLKSQTCGAGVEGYDMQSLGGVGVSPEEQKPHLPGACSMIFPVRGHVRGSVVRIMGGGACSLDPLP